MNQLDKIEKSKVKMSNDDIRKALKEINFDAISFENLDELEEIVTPGNGIVSCCQ